MKLEEAKPAACAAAQRLGEPTSVVPYGETFVVETKANAIANGFKRIYDTDGVEATALCVACRVETSEANSPFCHVCGSLNPEERAATQPEIDCQQDWPAPTPGQREVIDALSAGAEVRFCGLESQGTDDDIVTECRPRNDGKLVVTLRSGARGLAAPPDEFRISPVPEPKACVNEPLFDL